jgi:hypothetical protein
VAHFDANRCHTSYSHWEFSAANLATTSLTSVGNEADLIQRQASASSDSWPRVNFAQPETGIFRTVHKRGRTLGRVVSANRTTLDGLALDSPLLIPLPKALEGIHRGVLPLGVGPSVRLGKHGHHIRKCTVCDSWTTRSASLPTSVKDVLTCFGGVRRGASSRADPRGLLLGELRCLLPQQGLALGQLVTGERRIASSTIA